MSDDDIVLAEEDSGEFAEDSKEKVHANNLATLPKESLKSLLYLASGGRPDSSYRIFKELVFIEASDIEDLNAKVDEKLNHYECSNMVSVDIMFKNNQSIHFAAWAEFQDYDWKNSKVVDSLTIRWDFIATMPKCPIPQRHTLTVKFLSGLDLMHLLQAISSRDAEDVTNIERENAPIVARVDFINHLLSEELLNLVHEWVRSRKQADFLDGWRLFLKKHRLSITRIAHYSLPVLFVLLAFSILKWYGGFFAPDTLTTTDISIKFLYWVLFAGVSIPLANIIGHALARRVYNSLNDYGNHRLFHLTQGDKKEHEKIKSGNRKQLIKFFLSAAFAILLNIIAAMISWFFLKS